MNRNKLKVYAPKARRDFIKAVTDRAAIYGLTKKKIEPVIMQGDVAIIGGKPFPRDVAKKRGWLEERIRREGFEQVMEAMAYTWFNRFVAIRYMEVHGYLEHGYHVFSTTNHTNKGDEGLPEVLGYAEHLELPGVDRGKVVELKLAGNRDEDLYRMLLVGQCNALHKAMPFLFEKVGDATELLLPENLLHSDSLIRRMVNEVPEEEWEAVEIIGWLYQFYISEKKDQVIGKVVKSEDIPAATQLFTPNWIVKYMVQNSLGAQWLATYPHSPLKNLMEYYIEPAQQTPEVEAQLRAITPDSLNPEELTLADVACGSGHILVEGYDLFKAIYQERGYRTKDIPKLILEKNLYGLDIDDRAAQLAAFALMMKAREDDRRIFERRVKLNVMALVDSAGFDAEGLAKQVVLGNYGLKLGEITELKRLFEHARTFGSLIQVPDRLAEKLPALKRLSDATSTDIFVAESLQRLAPLVQQAELLAARYDAAVANPPYMGSKGMNTLVKKFAQSYFPDAKRDLFACFIDRGYTLCKVSGRTCMVTMQAWMFLPSFDKMRERMLSEKTICTMAQIGFNSFPTLNSKFAVATVFSLYNVAISAYTGVFIDLNSAPQSANKGEVFLRRQPSICFEAATEHFKKIPGSPIVYWIGSRVRAVFSELPPLREFGNACSGLQTGNNDKYLRLWPEVSQSKTALRRHDQDSPLAGRWLSHRKGGDFRRWYGNQQYVLDWADDGREIKANPSARPQNTNLWFKEAVTWSHTSFSFGARYEPAGSTFNVEGPSYFSDDAIFATGLMCSAPFLYIMQLMNPTMHFLVGSVSVVPTPIIDQKTKQTTRDNSLKAIMMAKTDWNDYESSWDFKSLSILPASSEPIPTLESSYTGWIMRNREIIAEMKRLEEENNRLFIEAYGLAEELTPEVPIEQITLTVNPAYRYGGKLPEEEQWTRFRQDTMQELVSYAIGCMMGRYSLDAPGLIYAHSGGQGFDPGRYTTFPADADGIVPLTGIEWFDDDACHRLIEFISVAWDLSHLEKNLTFLADNLSPKKNESSRETLRRYLCDSFFKDHLQTYKKRPIYWLFSSGKQKAFQCLVYLHRYNEGTLARMRTEYVIPLQGKISARIEQLAGDISAATSTAHSKKLEKERSTLIKQQAELQSFDEKLRHYADQRISLDLDDGVKVNYGKFGDLLAEVNAVTGGK